MDDVLLDYAQGKEKVIEMLRPEVEAEGFSFGDGEKPTSKTISDLYVVNRDWSLNYVGFIGHIAYKSAKTVGKSELIRVDYEKYVLGFSDFIIQ